MIEYITRRFYRRMDSSISAKALSVLSRVFDKWEREHEPFEFTGKVLFPWLEVLDMESQEYGEYNDVMNDLMIACRAYSGNEYREKRDASFKGNGQLYLVPKFTFVIYHEKCMLAFQGLDVRRNSYYPDYLKFLKERMLKEKLTPYQRFHPDDFFQNLYVDFTGAEKVNYTHPVCVMRCLEHYGIVPPREVGKQPRVPLAYLESLLKGLYDNVEFLKSLIPDCQLFLYD